MYATCLWRRLCDLLACSRHAVGMYYLDGSRPRGLLALGRDICRSMPRHSLAFQSVTRKRGLQTPEKQRCPDRGVYPVKIIYVQPVLDRGGISPQGYLFGRPAGVAFLLFFCALLTEGGFFRLRHPNVVCVRLPRPLASETRTVSRDVEELTAVTGRGGWAVGGIPKRVGGERNEMGWGCLTCGVQET